MKAKILICPNCKEETRHLVGNKYTAAGKRQGRLRRKIEHCTKCNIRRKSKK